MRRIASILAMIALITVLQRGDAQTNDSPLERPDLWTKVQDLDTLWIFLPRANGDTLNPNVVSGSYEFTMQFDSTCLTRYLFTEPWHNGNRLKLLYWKLGRSVNLGENYLSLNSRTEDFTLHTGDSISFVRSFRWFDAITLQQDTSNFFSLDTLTYVVELARAHDSARYQTRIAVIDSFGVMPRTTPGLPRFFSSGNRNVYARVGYVVPSSLNGKPVFLRVRVRARGSSEYYFTRTDDFTVNFSGLLDNPGIIAHNSVLNQNKYWAKTALGDDASTRASTVRSYHRLQDANHPEVTNGSCQEGEPDLPKNACPHPGGFCWYYFW